MNKTELKEMNESSKTEGDTGFWNEGYERKTSGDEIAKLEDDMNPMKPVGSCSSAASTGVGLGSGTFTKVAGQTWQEVS